MTKQLIRDKDYGDDVDAIKPAGNVYKLTAPMVGDLDLPIYAKAIFIPTARSITVVGARDKRETPVGVQFDAPAGYFQMEVRRITAIGSVTGVRIFHDNKTEEGDEVPGES